MDWVEILKIAMCVVAIVCAIFSEIKSREARRLSRETIALLRVEREVQIRLDKLPIRVMTARTGVQPQLPPNPFPPRRRIVD